MNHSRLLENSVLVAPTITVRNVKASTLDTLTV